MDEADHRLTDLFGVLQNPVRFSILKRLRNNPHSVTDLIEALDRPQNVVSNHLRILRDHDLVEARAKGNQRLYRLRRPDLVSACLELRDHLSRD